MDCRRTKKPSLGDNQVHVAPYRTSQLALPIPLQWLEVGKSPLANVAGQAQEAGQGQKSNGRDDQQGREDKGQHSRKGRLSVSDDSAPYWFYEGALPRIQEKHLANQDAVCAFKLVDGASSICGDAGRRASENGIEALQPEEMLSDEPKTEWISNLMRVNP